MEFLKLKGIHRVISFTVVVAFLTTSSISMPPSTTLSPISSLHEKLAAPSAFLNLGSPPKDQSAVAAMVPPILRTRFLIGQVVIVSLLLLVACASNEIKVTRKKRRNPIRQQSTESEESQERAQAKKEQALLRINQLRSSMTPENAVPLFNLITKELKNYIQEVYPFTDNELVTLAKKLPKIIRAINKRHHQRVALQLLDEVMRLNTSRKRNRQLPSLRSLYDIRSQLLGSVSSEQWRPSYHLMPDPLDALDPLDLELDRILNENYENDDSNDPNLQDPLDEGLDRNLKDFYRDNEKDEGNKEKPKEEIPLHRIKPREGKEEEDEEEEHDKNIQSGKIDNPYLFELAL